MDKAFKDCTDERSNPHQPQLLQRPTALEKCQAKLRRGFSDVFLTGILIRWIKVSAKPMAIGQILEASCRPLRQESLTETQMSAKIR